MKTIGIRTTQNVFIDYELADVKDRIFAFLIDGLVYGVFTFLVYIILMTFLSSFYMLGEWIFRFIVIFLYTGWIFYHVLFEIFNNGQSIGKKALGIKVVRLDGKEAGAFNFMLRGVFHLIDTLFSAGVIGIVLIASTDKNQRLGDMAANTTVIKTKSSREFTLHDILGIQNLDNYEPVFPEVRNLNEEEMLLIKTAINRYHEFPNKSHKEAIEMLEIRIKEVLQIEEKTGNPINFLKTLLKDYIVLTR
ncbi:MAG: RDD family protein [Saprospiraceae bacterium]|nr:RDD family protein [Saprospiraceae bacterium]